MEHRKILEGLEVQSSKKEAFESFSLAGNISGLAFTDNTFLEESCKLVDNVFEEIEIPSRVIEVEEKDDAGNEESLALVRDSMVGVVDNVAGLCDIGFDSFVNVASLEFESFEGNELDVVSQYVGVEEKGCEARDDEFGVFGLMDRVGKSGKVGLVDSVVGAVTKGGVAQCEGHKRIDIVKAQTDAGSVDALLGVEGDIVGIGGTDDHDLLNDSVDGENGYLRGFDNMPLDTMLGGNGNNKSGVQNVVIDDGMRKEEQSRISGKQTNTFTDGGSLSVELSCEANCNEQVDTQGRLRSNEGVEVSLVANLSEDQTRLMEPDQAESNYDNAGGTRLRRKSKYLSYPFENWAHNGLPSKPKYAEARYFSPGSANTHAEQLTGSPSITKPCSSKILKKTWAEKFMTRDTIPCTSDLVNEYSEELLSKLKFTAMDCLYPMNNGNFDAIKLFILRFRTSVYVNESIYEEHVQNKVGQNEALAAGRHMEFASKLNPKSQKKQPILNHTKATQIQTMKGNSCRLAEKSSHGIVETGYNVPKNKRGQKIGLEGTNQMGSSDKSPTDLLEVNINFDPRGMYLKGLITEMHAVRPYARSERKRRKKSKDVPLTYDDISGNKLTTIPELHVSNAFLPCGAQAMNGNKAESCFLYVDLQLPIPRSHDIIPKNHSSAVQFNHNVDKVNSGLLVQDLPVICPFTAKEKHRQRVRKRKKKTVVNYSDTGRACGIHGSYEISKALNSSENILLEADSVLLVKQEKKRVRSGKRKAKGREKNVAQDMLDKLSTNDTRDANRNGLGTAVLLTFAQGAIIPSKEVLVATFSRFGSLKESETQLLKDCGTAQVVFMRCSDAIKAFQNLEECNPFDATLASYSLHQSSAASSRKI